MPLQATSGVATYDAFGGGAATAANYIEDMFQTWLYTGNGSTQTITNGIDLTGKGGLVWLKRRSSVQNHLLFDTTRGATQRLFSNLTNAQDPDAQSLTAFTASGFSLGTDSGGNGLNETYASWTFAKQEKFFDVVTYTGTGSVQNIAHNLGATPGCIIVKNITNVSNWVVYHRSIGATQRGVLNSTVAFGANSLMWNNTEPTSTVFTVGTGDTNTSGDQFVAYLFAHDAGGFGLSGTDNVISCGSTDGNGTVTLGYEPQFVLLKQSDGVGDWLTLDTMRGFSLSSDQYLSPNTSAAESGSGIGTPNATGFSLTLGSGTNFIYIAIRRGPMRTPTTGTSVFSPYAATTPGNAVVTTGFPVDFQMQKNAGVATDMRFVDRLRGVSTTPTSPSAAFPFLVPSDTAAESTGTGTTLNWNNTGFTVGNTYSGSTPAWAVNFQRAPGFFDEVCYTGTGSPMLVNHNLGVPPELIITKRRNAVSTLGWIVSSLYWFASTPWDRNGRLNQTNALSGGGVYEPASSHSATQYPVSTATSDVNDAGGTYVAYLFATCPGVSKVGLYTGTGTTQTINCGFTAGSRFVMIKRADDVGDWYVWDSARGIVAGNDPYLLLNSTAAEVTSTDYVDTAATGFELSSTAPAALNASGGSYIFLAIA